MKIPPKYNLHFPSHDTIVGYLHVSTARLQPSIYTKCQKLTMNPSRLWSVTSCKSTIFSRLVVYISRLSHRPSTVITFLQDRQQSHLIITTIMNHLTILALALAGANAAGLSKRQYSESDDYLQQVCAPADEAGNRDWSAPCNAVLSIQYECGYGTAGGELIRNPPRDIDDQYGDDDEGPPEQPYDAQRICVCQSQFRDQVTGCMKCFKDHGGVEGNDWFSPSLIDPAMNDYCNASAPATESFADFLFTHVMPDGETDTESESSTFSDPIGNKTDVSLYFTPSVTGT